MNIKLRYNTAVVIDEQSTEPTLYWRVLIDNVEHLASDVIINVPTQTTKDYIEGVGIKHHITCESDNVIWDNKKVIVS